MAPRVGVGVLYLRWRPLPRTRRQQVGAPGCKRPLRRSPCFRNDQAGAVFRGIRARKHTPACAGLAAPRRRPADAPPRLWGPRSLDTPAPRFLSLPFFFILHFTPDTKTSAGTEFWGHLYLRAGGPPRPPKRERTGLRALGSRDFSLKKKKKNVEGSVCAHARVLVGREGAESFQALKNEEKYIFE